MFWPIWIIFLYMASLALLLATGTSLRATALWCVYFVSVQGLWRLLERRFPYCGQRRPPRKNPALLNRRNRTDVLMLLAKDTLVNLLLPVGLIPIGALVQQNGIGLLNGLHAPAWLQIVMAVLVIDRIAFDVHRWLHAHPLLRDVHAVHHAGEAMDSFSVLRLHPLESLLRAVINVGAVIVFGLSPLGLLIAGGLRVFFAAWHHSAVYVPPRLERALSPWLTTPALHRLHHACDRRYYNSNYGQIFSFWDRLHGTFRAVARRDPQSARVQTGVRDARLPDQNDWMRLLLLPVLRKPRLRRPPP